VKQVAVALLRHGDRWFLQRRDPGNPVLPGCWEFPGGKVEEGESAAEALGRELREEVDLGLTHLSAWPALVGEVQLNPFLIDAEGEPRTELAWGWFTPAEMLRLPLPPLNLALIRQLAESHEGRAVGSPPPI